MDKRFTTLRPETCDNPKQNGAEPCLADIIEGYYTAHGIPIERAKRYAAEYVAEWVKLETANVEVQRTPKAIRWSAGLGVIFSSTLGPNLRRS